MQKLLEEEDKSFYRFIIYAIKLEKVRSLKIIKNGIIFWAFRPKGKYLLIASIQS